MINRMTNQYAPVTEATLVRAGRFSRTSLWASGVLALMLASPVHAQAASSEHEAAVRRIVLGIISYTHWPQPRDNVRLCVTGRTRFTLDASGGGSPPGAPPVVTRAVQPADLSIGNSCDALYLGELSEAERAHINARIAGNPVLTISEHDSTCTLGAMFCLNDDAGRVTFDINLDSVARSGVRVSPNVLGLAHKRGAS
ncbi:MAG TPA: YfiR family protein [Paraburkholderia sp.]|jgi:hypothetical protein|nr:YfiR family protein [Paraburkholderia sp.]